MMRTSRLLYWKKLPTAWASSYFQSHACRARPLLSEISAALLAPSLVLAPAHAQSSTPASSSPTSPLACASSAHQAFDFWLGVWEVTASGQDKPSAINKISQGHGGCVIREDYRTTGGYTGMSMSFYDMKRKTWHQTWMGADGGALYIEGGLNESGAMVLSNRNTPYYTEGSPVNRVTWTPNEDGSVRQHWQSSQDSGKTWATVFDGLYVKRDALSAE